MGKSFEIRILHDDGRKEVNIFIHGFGSLSKSSDIHGLKYKMGLAGTQWTALNQY